MRFAYILLGVVTLASVHTSRGVCSDGVEGVQTGDVCCEAQCGSCGGPTCGNRPGGREGCCQSVIRDSGVKCSESLEAPCVIDVCSNGVPGVESGDICCDAECGTCGGKGCVYRPGGKNSCCTQDIRANGVMCSETSQAPCIIDGADIEES